MSRISLWAMITMVHLLIASQGYAVSMQGDKIINKATLTTDETLSLETSVVVTVVTRTSSKIEFLKYSPTAPGTDNMLVPATYYHDGVPQQNPPVNGEFTPVAPPLKVGTQNPIDLSVPIPLVVATVFHAGEPVFVRTTDLDQNIDKTKTETIIVTITDPSTGDSEILRLTESGPDTGTFLGYFQTVSTPAQSYNGQLSVVNASTINAHYVDIVDGTDTAADAALIDPFGLVFSTITGLPVDGATVQILNATSGEPAAVFGDDGVSTFPATVISGSTVNDSSGKTYAFPPGNFRFPFIAPGQYQLKVTPPNGYSAPSTVSTAQIQTLPGAPYVILEPGSRGEPFQVNYGPAVQVDIPLDPLAGSLWLKKSADKSVVTPGDFVGYEITLENTDPAGTIYAAVAQDTLPVGFSYRKGSTMINGIKAEDPAISADGRTLTYNIGTIPPKTSVTIRYVVGVAAGARPGAATNSVTVTTAQQTIVTSAKATVQVLEPFLRNRSIVMGRVVVGSCSGSPDEQKKGMEGIGIYLEDGTFVLSDKLGMFHFEGVRPGVHVLQLDLDSIPEGYQILPCEQNSRFAGRAYSQFIDLQGGTMWRTDFYLGKAGLQQAAESRLDARMGSRNMMTTLPEAATTNEPSHEPVSSKMPDSAPPKALSGEIAIELLSTQTGNMVDYRLPLHVAIVPLQNMRLSVSLPTGTTYQPGSSSINGNRIADPELSGTSLTYSLGESSPKWRHEVQFRAVVDSKAAAGELVTRAKVSFDSPSTRNQMTGEITNIIALTKDEESVPMPPVVFRPQFPTFGAELADEDRAELDRLADQLADKIIKRVDVVGHTDNVRIAPRSRDVYADNGALSYARARSVGRYLSARLHLPPESLNLIGCGDKAPLAPNRTAEGRALNRRVEVIVTSLRTTESAQLQMIKDHSGISRLATLGVAPAEPGPAGTGLEQPVANGSQMQTADTKAGSEPVLKAPATPEPDTVTAQQEQPERSSTATFWNGPATRQISGSVNPLLLFKVVPNDGLFTYRIRLSDRELEGKQMTLVITVPPAVLYMTGTSRLNGTSLSDPEVRDTSLLFTITAPPAGDAFDLRFQAMADGETATDALSSQLILTLKESVSGRQIKEITAKSSMNDQPEDLGKQPVAETASQQTSSDNSSINDRLSYQEKMPQSAAETVGNSAPHVRDDEGILTPADGSYVAGQFNSVRIVLNSALKPLLLLDGKQISEERIGFNMKDSETDKSLYTYIGVDFGSEGAHTVELQGIDPFGQVRFRKTAQVTRTGEITAIKMVSAEGNMADGKTPVRVRILLMDRDGKPVQASAELLLKEGTLKPLPTAGVLPRDPQGSLVTVSGDGWINFQPVTASGIYRSVLSYNRASVDIETYVKPKLRDWILVGIAEGTAGYKTVSGHMENLRASDVEENLYDKERLAFYTKGTIKGEWLLTMSYDSSGKKTGAGNGLFQTIDPNAFYTLYGDATTQLYDAASSRKIYLKIERDQFYAMFGDFDSGLTVTELSRYSRRMTGIKTELRAKEYELAAFGSETGQSFVKDELRGDGTSGLYRLSRSDIVINSEHISIEARDRFKSEVIVTSRKLNRFSDYTIDYTSGTIFFKEPVPSKDEAFNPVYIVVDYEVTNGGKDALTYGGRAGAKLADGAVKVGASYIHEGQVSGGSDLYGLDGSLLVGSNTRIRAEIATSNRDAGTNRGNGSAYLAELNHQDGNLDGKLYYREQDEGFGLGQQKASEAGTRKFGLELAYKLSESFTVNSQAYRQYNLLTGAVRNLLETAAVYTDRQYGARLGIRYAGDNLEDGRKAENLQMTVGGSWKTMDNRLTLRLDHEQSLIAPSTNVDYPTRTVIGADFLVVKDVALFAQEELTYGDAANSTNTRVGVKASPWSGGTVASTLVQDMKENGDRTYASVGLAQKWQINPSWSIDGGFDQNRTVRKKSGYRFNANVPPTVGSEDFTAVSLGANYLQNRLAWSNRFELRTSDQENKWGLISGLINEQGLNWGWTGRLQLLHTDGDAGSSKTDAELRLGFAYRPPVTRWIVLDRLDLVSSDGKNSGTSTVSRRVINNLNANYRPDKQTQISLQYGAKYVTDTIDAGDYSGYTDLMGVEGRYDITSTLDVGLRGAMLHTWETNQFSYSLAPTVGFNVMENAWLNLGYNIIGYEDRDFSKGSFTARGPFVQFRFKFDQNSVKDGLKMLNQ